ncbi:hypothetical protein ACQUSR_19140 [Streptomyces sp. P1-3]|uniref:hypothetical protein n=1 Tax=Streptomyces sp. P1-3 TaxID=3421658 RepID=UPI003D35E3CA
MRDQRSTTRTRARLSGLRQMTLPLAVLLAVGGCLPGSKGDKEQEDRGPTYEQAMDALYPDAKKAVKATMPDGDIEEIAGGQTECGGPDIIDSKDASKLLANAAIRVPGKPEDKRSAARLVEEVVDSLRSQGWTIEPGQNTPPGHSDGVTRNARKPGVSGMVEVTAYPFRLTSGKISQTLIADVITGCLRNPKWNKD